MTILVKCKICGNKVDRDVAYKIVIDRKNNYYCNENEYNEWKSAKDIKDGTYLIIYDIFGRKITNTILYKEIGELSDIYGFKKIYAYLKENERYLTETMGKDFKSEYAQIRYFTAILKNSLSDFIESNKQVIPKSINSEPIDMKYRQIKRRRSISEIEEEI